MWMFDFFFFFYDFIKGELAKDYKGIIV
jgi:hypothetical protein